ncbi:PQQ-dependent dehydrogenase, methanol/ethanol family [Novosphingobium tardum]|uniref:PQQ-dependent dehydrogenase, methanol/ethanol family n=1 Tax=Novosphingobium tardum TaxID=1538021 RepID=A0ABV8RSR5_9SPHN
MMKKSRLLLGLAVVAAVPAIAAGAGLFPDRETAKPPVPEAVPADAIFSREQIGHALAPPTPAAGRTVAPLAAAPADDGQWLMPAKNYAATRYSAMNEITPANARNLREVFSFSLGVDKGQEAAPLVIGSTMVVVSAFPNHVFALDLAREGAPLKWQYDPKPVPAAAGVACCDVVNRGAAYADGKVVFNTLDGATIALDLATGKEVWRTQLGDIMKGESITMAPLIAGGKVLVGDSGGEFGVHGWLTALDLGTGKIAWRAYHTGPDDQALIGPQFHPFYAGDRGQNLGVKTWPSDAWRIGGGTMWGWIAYDPGTQTIFYGTGNPGPWNAQARPGDNKWTSGMFARDVNTGQARWFYQFTPHDEHDYDGINEQILLDMPFAGKMRPVIVRPERNGYFYVLDRRTGQVLSADPFGPVNSSSGVDLRTGRLMVNPAKETKLGQVVRDICPTASGAKDWNPSSFSPRTGLVYIPHENLCMDWMNLEVNYISGTPYVGAEVKMKPGPGGNRGALTAWDPVRRRPAWELPEDLPVWSGTVVTGGDLVFYGTMDGWFKAVDARTGALAWKTKLPSGIIGQPISYRGPDGHQYIAILSGVGGWAGGIVSGPLDPRDGSSALGFVQAMTDLPNRTTAGGTLHVFALAH